MLQVKYENEEKTNSSVTLANERDQMLKFLNILASQNDPHVKKTYIHAMECQKWWIKCFTEYQILLL